MLTEEATEKTNVENKNITKILFVCTGNTCRSPMAEAVFNRFLSDGGRRAVSRGLFADGSAMSTNAEIALADIGIADFSHISQNVDAEIMRESDIIVGITSSHAMRLTLAFPQYASKITSMPRDIPDPYGGDINEYKACLEMIKESLFEMFQ